MEQEQHKVLPSAIGVADDVAVEVTRSAPGIPPVPGITVKRLLCLKCQGEWIFPRRVIVDGDLVEDWSVVWCVNCGYGYRTSLAELEAVAKTERIPAERIVRTRNALELKRLPRGE